MSKKERQPDNFSQVVFKMTWNMAPRCCRRSWSCLVDKNKDINWFYPCGCKTSISHYCQFYQVLVSYYKVRTKSMLSVQVVCLYFSYTGMTIRSTAQNIVYYELSLYWFRIHTAKLIGCPFHTTYEEDSLSSVVQLCGRTPPPLLSVNTAIEYSATNML